MVVENLQLKGQNFVAGFQRVTFRGSDEIHDFTYAVS